MFNLNRAKEEEYRESVQASIAEKVREQSRELSGLTAVELLGQFLPEIDTDDITAGLSGMENKAEYRDIKVAATSGGAVYLYSDTYIALHQADALVKDEDIKSSIAEKVRADSSQLAKLTGVDTLKTEVDGEPDIVEKTAAGIMEDERYGDIRSVTASAGAVYLYSETYISGRYAERLLRAEENDPCATIASTVRDEAKTYPRPTRIDFFKDPVFNIAPGELEERLADTLSREEFKDVKLINASTGARYLYSDLYLSEKYARSLIEWEEVGQFENP